MKSVVLLSGGLDSTVLLADRVQKGDSVLAVSFDYGQTHLRELKSAREVAKYYNVLHRIVGMRSVVLPSALTGQADIPTTHAETPDATTVPARNMIFISIASAIAEAEEADNLAIGVNADDNNGYIDCRPMFINAMTAAVKLATANSVNLLAPFMQMTKQQIVTKGYSLQAPMWMSWSCYRGGDQPCNNCGACQSRTEAGA